MQMNLKLGGQAWTVDTPFDDMMICGIDVYHDKSIKGESFAALVCSMDKQATHYYSQTSKTDCKREELLSNLNKLMASK